MGCVCLLVLAKLPCLDDHVPADHLLRHIDRFLDLESVRTALKPFYSSIWPAVR